MSFNTGRKRKRGEQEEETVRNRKIVRRRIISSSESDSEDDPADPPSIHTCFDDEEPGPSNRLPPTNITPSVPDPAEIDSNNELVLDEDILVLLGDAPKPETLRGKSIHKELAARWQEILKLGLSKDIKDKIIKDYLLPANCLLLEAPTLNAEIKAAIPDTLAKRDAYIGQKQNQLGIAISALAQAVEMCITKEPSHNKILKPISDACRLLCDNHFIETRTRRAFIISSINSDLKETVINTSRDEYLFGENMSEKLKSAKTIQRTGADLKQNKNQYNKFNKNNFIANRNNNMNKNRLNWKTLPRKTASKYDAGKQQFQAQRVPRNSYPRRETRPLPPPPPPPAPAAYRSDRSPTRRPYRRH